MSSLEQLKEQIQALSSAELAELHAWFWEYDWVAWDAQLAHDIEAGRLDALADAALRDDAAGRTTPL